jgi:hypothetical protein
MLPDCFAIAKLFFFPAVVRATPAPAMAQASEAGVVAYLRPGL